jgi:hypothetical protein
VAQKRTGLIILGVVIFVVVVLIGMVGVGGFVLYTQFSPKTENRDAVSAERELARTLERFKGQQPFIDLDGDEPAVNRTEPPASPAPIDALHVMVWQPDEQKLFKMAIPMWLVRLSGDKPMRISPGRHRSDLDLRLTVRDLERHGPGLIVNQNGRRGEHVIVWAE